MLVVFCRFFGVVFLSFLVVQVALWSTCILTVSCSSLVHPTVFFKACPEAHSDSLAYPLCNRLFIGPKLVLRMAIGVCDFTLVLDATFSILPVLVSAGVGGFLNARPSG